jgi:predicted N-acyltransferase
VARNPRAIPETQFAERGNHPALTLGFFRHLGAAMPRQVIAVLCKRDTQIIAMALLLRSSATLYGRYWGCVENVAGAAFRGMLLPGHRVLLTHRPDGVRTRARQGEHKLARGFLPTKTRRFHYLGRPALSHAVREALGREARALDEYRAELMAHLAVRAAACRERASLTRETPP